MRLRWSQPNVLYNNLVMFIGAVKHPDGSLHIYETTEYPDKKRTQLELFPDEVTEVNHLLIPIGTILLMNKKGYMDDKSCIDTVNTLLASHEFQIMMQEQGWKDVNFGPWIKDRNKASNN